MRLLGVCLVAMLWCGGALASAAAAAPGDLDPSFGTGGTVITDVGTNNSTEAGPGGGGVLDSRRASTRGVARQGDGKILVVGPPIPLDPATNKRVGSSKLVRYNRDGSLDATFAVGGKADTIIQGTSLALQPDGKIVIAGFDYPDSTPANTYVWALARYNPDGSLDTSFGTGGKVLTQFQNTNPTSSISNIGTTERAIADRVAIQPDGKIVAAGDANLGSIFAYRQIAVARYTTDGSPDITFGNNGQTQITLDTVYSDLPFQFSDALALQGDGKIVVGTTNQNPNTGTRDFLLVRLLPQGAPDPDFGTALGRVTTTFGGIDELTDIAIHGDKIIAVGSTSRRGVPPPLHSGLPPNADFAVARYNQTDGSLDPSFGSGGKVTTDFGGDDHAYAVAAQSDGKLVVAGSTSATSGSSDPSDFALARYRPDGSLDPSFNGDGTRTTRLGPQADSIRALAIQPDDGKIIAAGSTLQNDNEAFGLARYQGAPDPASSTPSGSTLPGSTPPGSTPPGSTPPGSTPPGSTPPGSTPPGRTPPVGLLPRANLVGLRLGARRVVRGRRTSFIVRGALLLPSSIPSSKRSLACRGLVTVAARRGHKTAASKTVGLRKNCSFSLTITMPTSKLGHNGRYNIHARFHGNRFHGNLYINARSQTINVR